MGLLLLMQVGAVIRALQLPTDLKSQLSLTQPTLIATALLWSVVFGWAFLQCMGGKKRALNRALWVICGFMFYSTGRLVIFARADYDRQRLPFLVVSTLLLGIIFAGLGWLLRRKTNE